MTTKQLQAALFYAVVTGLALAGCGGDKEKESQKQPMTNTSSSPSAPPVIYTAEHIRRSLVAPRDVDPSVREAGISLLSLSKRSAPMCSLSQVTPTGRPDITIRQFSNPVSKPGGASYAQFIARYSAPQDADASFEAIGKRAKSCPAKQQVPPKRLTKDFIQFEHNDTWKVTEDDIQGWKHLRGIERQIVPASKTKLNVSYLIYDYAVRGNTVLATLYWQRTDPGKSGDPIVNRATEVLAKQLQKIG